MNSCDNSKDIFKYLNPDENEILTKLKGYDLQDIIILINNYYLTLRKKLGLDNSITIGLELEFEYANNKKIEKNLNQKGYSEWILKGDASLIKGAEINSPILIDNIYNWKDLENICSIVNQAATISQNSAGHIHIGAHILGKSPTHWLNFIKIWAVYENIIYRFLYGEFLTHRPSMMKYARPLAFFLWEKYQELNSLETDIDDILYEVNDERRQAINFENIDTYDYYEFDNGNTIEFRCPNGTLNEIIWQNNVNLLVKLLLYCTSSSFNNDIIDKRQQINIQNKIAANLYNEIFLDQALELADMIFSNNLDKIYFLRQYLKSFKIVEDNLEFGACKATPFTYKKTT